MIDTQPSYYYSMYVVIMSLLMLVLYLDLDSVPCAFDFCELSLLRQDLSYSNTMGVGRGLEVRG